VCGLTPFFSVYTCSLQDVEQSFETNRCAAPDGSEFICYCIEVTIYVVKVLFLCASGNSITLLPCIESVECNSPRCLRGGVLKPWFLRTTHQWIRKAWCVVPWSRKRLLVGAICWWFVRNHVMWSRRRCHWYVSRPACQVDFCVLRRAVCIKSLILRSGIQIFCDSWLKTLIYVVRS
jgi:hypothetical protein